MRNRVGDAIADMTERRLASLRGEGASAQYSGAGADDIVFEPLDPVKASSDSFPQISDPLVRRHCTRVAFEDSLYYVHNRCVHVLEAAGPRLVASVRGSALYRLEVLYKDNQLIGRCTCQLGAAKDLTAVPLTAMLCRHSVAAVRTFMGGQTAIAHSAADVTCVCPVTRKKLSQGSLVYQCRVCYVAYSPEGWAFLQEVDRGRCCSCRNKNTVIARI